MVFFIDVTLLLSCTCVFCTLKNLFFCLNVLRGLLVSLLHTPEQENNLLELDHSPSVFRSRTSTMKIRRLPFSLLLLAQAISASSAETILENDVTRAPSDVLPDNGLQEAPRIVPRGSVDAPVDGQDGRPHEGPFVETNAERDRKKSSEWGSLGDSSSYDVENPSQKLDGDNIPASNDGVMDDRVRSVPKEGTRGTEGGISEKSGSGEMKTPDSPKEPLPLPDSAYEKDPEYSTKVKNSEESSGMPLEVRALFEFCGH